MKQAEVEIEKSLKEISKIDNAISFKELSDLISGVAELMGKRIDTGIFLEYFESFNDLTCHYLSHNAAYTSKERQALDSMFMLTNQYVDNRLKVVRAWEVYNAFHSKDKTEADG